MAALGRQGSTQTDDIVDLTATPIDLVGWRTASADVSLVEADRGSRWRRGAPNGRALPKGEKHAYRPGDTATACGVPVDGLHTWIDQPYGDGLLNRCPACLTTLRSQVGPGHPPR